MEYKNYKKKKSCSLKKFTILLQFLIKLRTRGQIIMRWRVGKKYFSVTIIYAWFNKKIYVN